MNYQTILCNLYYLLIYADGNANAKEIASCNQMVFAEGIPAADFDKQMKSLVSRNQQELLDESIVALKKLTRVQQIRVIAWLCVLANADGFMERSEWQLIYRIYHKELALPLNEIFDVQKELNRVLWLNQTISSN